jgi:hypothetical protein
MKEIRCLEKSQLDGRFYIELSPGRYAGTHWRDESVYIDDEVFGLLEIEICRQVGDYDHWGVNEVSGAEWLEIINGWSALSVQLATATEFEQLYGHLGFLFAGSRDWFHTHFEQCSKQLAELIERLISWLQLELSRHDRVAIIGV